MEKDADMIFIVLSMAIFQSTLSHGERPGASGYELSLKNFNPLSRMEKDINNGTCYR